MACVAVLQADDDGLGAERADDMQALAGQQLGAETEPVGAVVVAGDDDHRHAEAAHDAVEGVVEQADSLDRRHRAVVHIAGDEHGVWPHLAHERRRTGPARTPGLR